MNIQTISMTIVLYVPELGRFRFALIDEWFLHIVGRVELGRLLSRSSVGLNQMTLFEDQGIPIRVYVDSDIIIGIPIREPYYKKSLVSATL